MRREEPGTAVDLDALERFDSIIDVRSPAEFAQDHLPGSSNHPVLDDAQRAAIGTLHAQVSPFAARRSGAALVARNIAHHLEQSFAGRPREWRPLVLCWRGGQRSGSMVTVLRAVGWDARQLAGGYKTWRSHVMAQLAELPGRLRLRVIGGPTGSGKSRLLQALREDGSQVLDLEALAAHRGSVLGALPGEPQPPQRLFESRLYDALRRLDPARPVFVEAESRRIGVLHVPDVLIRAMRASPCHLLEAGEAPRVALLLEEYGHLWDDPEGTARQLERLVELHGHDRIGHWQGLLAARELRTLAEELVRTHYDPLYRRSSHSNYQGMGQAARLDGGALGPEDFRRLARELRDVP